jgi:hypothetical protein
MAIPDHPWTKATRDAAAVRIAMTVGVAGTHEGRLREVVREAALDTDQPAVELSESAGMINADLTSGVDVTTAIPLKANEHLLAGCEAARRRFIVTPQEAEHLGSVAGQGWTAYPLLPQRARSSGLAPRGDGN